ncbi:hypothetical protein AA313_de0205903 [Arthrobotrys entomopaga]|nr:hypothetical protein AA313_de0205903 [Arthrobotrys entomopaga]
MSDRSSSPDNTHIDNNKEAEVSFRLFAPTKDSNSDDIHTYILPASPPPEAHTLLSDDQSTSLIPPHFTESDIQKAHATHRPLNYYLAITPPPEDDYKVSQIRDMAVSGEDILRQSQQRWWGCEVPWRVLKLRLVDKSHIEKEKKPENPSNVIHEALPITTEVGRKRRTRPSKKRRIKLRTIRAAEEAKAVKAATKKKNKKKKAEVAQAVAAIHKRTDEEDREKKTRLNRLKKARRRLKEQEKKKKDGVVSTAS